MNAIDFTWRPIDTLYFGPPVSIAAGEVNHGRSLFPPPPMTFQGMVRTRLLAAAKLAHSLDDWSAEANDERKELVGEPDRLPQDWQLAGPFPARLGATVEPWFPAPRFALKGRNHKPGGRPVTAHRIVSTHPGCDDLNPKGDGAGWEVGAPEQDAGEAMGGWVSAHNLRWLLSGQGCWDEEGFGHDLPPFVERETRTGLAIDSVSGTAMDGLLYALSTLRMKAGSGFLGRLTANLKPGLHAASLTSGIGAAGRGARPVQFGAAAALDPSWQELQRGTHLPSRVEDGALFWLVTIAPARVGDFQAPITKPIPPGVTPIVRAALIGPALVLGGLSMVTGDSRSNRAHVPAGSAWLIELRGGDAGSRRAALDALHDKPSIGATEDHCFGFGHTLVGLHAEA